jgi:hypothetical protein
MIDPISDAGQESETIFKIFPSSGIKFPRLGDKRML